MTSELALERSGPERFLSAYPLLAEAITTLSERGQLDKAGDALGRLLAHLMTLRQMSLSVAGLLEQGHDPATEAALIKDMGMNFEQEVPRIVEEALEATPDAIAVEPLARMLEMVTLLAPSFSIRGGTREIMRSIIARDLGLR